MTGASADKKIKEILTKVNGQGKLAEQAIRTLIERDHAFLLSLVEPYINGIILHGIERVRKTTGMKEPPASQAQPEPRQPMPKVAAKAKPSATSSMTSGGMDDLMKAWAKTFNEGKSTKEPGQTVSQKHVDALKALAKNQGKKK